MILLLLCCPALASAGAWMREKGQAFVAATATPRLSDSKEQSVETALYGEYGLRDWLTLGIDVNQAMSFEAVGGHMLLFARLPILQSSRVKLAVEAAAGQHMRDEQSFSMRKLTLSAGMGFAPDWGPNWGSGWLSVDLAVEDREGVPDPIMKLDATLGLPNYGKFGPMLQLETAKTGDSPVFWTVTPGLRYETEKAGTWVIGAERKNVGQDKFWGLKIGVWRRF